MASAKVRKICSKTHQVCLKKADLAQFRAIRLFAVGTFGADSRSDVCCFVFFHDLRLKHK